MRVFAREHGSFRDECLHVAVAGTFESIQLAATSQLHQTATACVEGASDWSVFARTTSAPIRCHNMIVNLASSTQGSICRRCAKWASNYQSNFGKSMRAPCPGSCECPDSLPHPSQRYTRRPTRILVLPGKILIGHDVAPASRRPSIAPTPDDALSCQCLSDKQHSRISMTIGLSQLRISIPIPSLEAAHLPSRTPAAASRLPTTHDPQIRPADGNEVHQRRHSSSSLTPPPDMSSSRRGDASV
ncbi:hypothetical protein R3P38DRAFT_1776812 [Favolaschia claudopus]|uniref:Uncharacterized protein n=1 Tax=Favolaschia claudopus TaxID=2862362 RepID=A0AAW0A8J3_9AGAR